MPKGEDRWGQYAPGARANEPIEALTGEPGACGAAKVQPQQAGSTFALLRPEGSRFRSADAGLPALGLELDVTFAPHSGSGRQAPPGFPVSATRRWWALGLMEALFFGRMEPM
jgi:hypothetical protein